MLRLSKCVAGRGLAATARRSVAYSLVAAQRLSSAIFHKVPSSAARYLATKADTSSGNYATVYDNNNKITLDPLDTFARRHLGPNPTEVALMLASLGYQDMDQFLSTAVPEHVLVKRPLQVQPLQGFTESQMLEHLHQLAGKNKIVKSFIGKGYAGTIVPPVIQRNLLELPEWYTSYTPYQPEISQGRLELLLNYQTVVTSLTGLDMANASLLDEGTAAGEAMSLSFHQLKGKKAKYVVDTNLHPQTVNVIKSRAENLSVEIVELNLSTAEGLEAFQQIALQSCGAMVQYPDTNGEITDYSKIGEIVHENKGLFTMASDLLALTLLKSPASFGADIALGTSQRFGVPFGYGGPHAAFFATTSKLSRKIPGRIVGYSKDRLGKPALRLALQTREQHIKREKATSNICTAQALLANMSAMYAVYHGPEGLKNIAKRVYGVTTLLAEEIKSNSDFEIVNNKWFDTLTVRVTDSNQILASALEKGINLFRVDTKTISLKLDETITGQD